MPAFAPPAPAPQNDVPSMVTMPRTLLPLNARVPKVVELLTAPAPSTRATIRGTSVDAVLVTLPVTPTARLYPATTTYLPSTDSDSSPSDEDPDPVPARAKA